MRTTADRFAWLALDPRSRQPAYLQLAAQLRRRVTTGHLRPGDRLPPVRLLARRLGVNFNTTARAYRLLVQDGTLAAQPGRGTFVLNRPPRPPRRVAALRQAAHDFVTHAQRLGFDGAQITAVVGRELSHAGENHG